MVKYIILGAVQGITEFLPVSSSGHLVIIQRLIGLSAEGLALSIVLHLGTIAALIIFFFQDLLIILRQPRILLFIAIVTLITGVIAILGKDFFEKLFSLPRFVALALAVTGVILILTRRFRNTKRKNLLFKDAVILGLSQAIAIIPGISRSGITISCLLFRGIVPETAFRISFLASIPAVLGASLLEVKEISFILKTDFVNLAVGFTFSFLAGLISLWILKLVLGKAKLYYFGYYCIIVAIITLIFIK